MKTLDEIRNAIDSESQGRLSIEQIEDVLNAIECFSKEYHYLPDDVDDWYEAMSQYIYNYEMALDNIGGDWEG